MNSTIDYRTSTHIIGKSFDEYGNEREVTPEVVKTRQDQFNLVWELKKEYNTNMRLNKIKMDIKALINE